VHNFNLLQYNVIKTDNSLTISFPGQPG